ncbi:hypothetical protein HLB44_29960 [Aquincola sp. S2]|uniref:Tetratricopeptide repeat protein n=1 Tax=Pseudaquabacterium terrae TaxID=2732868 RepID=A0ABX2ERA2_9BURK|nr:hypothetical protein [Aquabacterium terrae]NRF71225.1 hypothetical protein [Aquabacterium terrae]
MAKTFELVREGKPIPRYLDHAKYRVALFSYEDPDETGLGEVIARLLGRELVIANSDLSFGVIRFGRLGSADTRDVGDYFEQVELLANAQRATLTVWGTIRAIGEELAIESYLQIPANVASTYLRARFRLPDAMGRGTLIGRLGSDRMLLQRLVLSKEAVNQLLTGAEVLTHARSQPDADARALGATDGSWSVLDKKSRPGWVLLRKGNARGWVPMRTGCEDSCASILEVGAFLGSLVRYMDWKVLDFERAARQIPKFTPGLSSAVREFVDQAQTLDQFAMYGDRAMSNQLDRWAAAAPGPGGVAPSFGAGSFNLDLIVKVAGLADRSFVRTRTPYDEQRFDPRRIREITVRAAQALQDDPLNVELLGNLGLLYRYLGDREKAQLAGKLLLEAQRSSRDNVLIRITP